MKYTAPKWPADMALSQDDVQGMMWGLWGSAGRNELSANSDIDILLWAPHHNDNYTPSSIASWDTVRPIDLLRVGISPYARATKSGIDLYAVYSATSLTGDQDLINEFIDTQERLYQDEYLRAREALHIILGNGSFGQPLPLVDQINLKTIPGGARAWAAMSIAHVFIYPEKLRVSNEDLWKDIAHKTDIDINTLNSARSYIKNLIENPSRNDSLGKLADVSKVWHQLADRYLTMHIEWIQNQLHATPELLESAIEYSIGNRIYVPASKSQNKNIDSFLRAAVTHDSDELDEMANEKSDWWTITFVTINPNTAANTLAKLAFPSWDYDQPGWRLPRGRIIDHQHTPFETIVKLANTDSNLVGTFPYTARKKLKLLHADKQVAISN